MNRNNSCSDCRAHSGLASDIEHLQVSEEAQWKEINAMKTRSTIILTGVVLNLLGIIGALLIMVIKLLHF